MTTYDAIVVGLGAHGSAAAAELGRRSARVLGLERFHRGHALGSSVGRSRIIRLAYFEHPDYVPLLRRAWDRWLDLERETGERLLVETGGLYVGAPGSAIVEGSLRSAREHGLAHEVLDAATMRERFPALRVDGGMVGLHEAKAGYLVPERCIEAHLALAERRGAALRFGEVVERWAADGSGVRVETTGGRYRAERLVIAAGAWLPRLLPDLGVPFEVERVTLFWFEPSAPQPFERLPVYIVETDWDGSFYGFPYLPDQGLKVARHGSGERADPDALDRSPRGADEERVRRFVRRHLPEGDGPLREAKVCLYTKTPDEHFVVDRHPAHERVVFASACSGHGFKFASVIGEALADLALDGRTSLPIGFLSLRRFARSGT